jgi:hypothetical protein
MTAADENAQRIPASAGDFDAFVGRAADADLRSPETVFQYFPGAWHKRDPSNIGQPGVEEYESKTSDSFRWATWALYERYLLDGSDGGVRNVSSARLMIFMSDTACISGDVLTEKYLDAAAGPEMASDGGSRVSRLVIGDKKLNLKRDVEKDCVRAVTINWTAATKQGTDAH